MFWSSGGSSASPASSRTPVTAMNTRLVAKLRSVNMARSNNGCFAVTMCTTNIHAAPIASASSIRVSQLDSQSFCSPRSRKSAAPPSAIASSAKPNMSNLRSCVSVLGMKRIMISDAQDPDRQIDQEHPAPVVIVGQPAAEHGAQDRADHHAAAEQRHRLAVLLARVDVEQGRLGERHDERAADALEARGTAPFRSARSRSRTAPRRR